MGFKFNALSGQFDLVGSGGGGGGDSFTIMQPDSGTAPTASSATDTLTWTGTNISFVGDSTSKTMTAVLGTVPVAKGGTNSVTALNNNRVIKSSGGAIVEAAAITAARALISDANGIPTHSGVTSTVLGYLDVGSSLTTLLAAKAPLASPTFTGTIGTPLTVSRVLVTDGSGNLAASTVTSTVLGYLDVGSSLTTLLAAKAPIASPNFTTKATFATNYYLTPGEVSNTSLSGAVAVDLSTGTSQLLSLSGNITALTFSNPTSGAWYLLRVSSASHTISWPSMKWAGGTAPTLSGSNTDFVWLYYDGTNYWGSAQTNWS